MSKDIRINIDLTAGSGNVQEVVNFLDTPANIQRVANYITAVILEEKTDFKVKTRGGEAHKCVVSDGERCSNCQEKLNYYPHGYRFD